MHISYTVLGRVVVRQVVGNRNFGWLLWKWKYSSVGLKLPSILKIFSLVLNLKIAGV